MRACARVRCQYDAGSAESPADCEEGKNHRTVRQRRVEVDDVCLDFALQTQEWAELQELPSSLGPGMNDHPRNRSRISLGCGTRDVNLVAAFDQGGRRSLDDPPDATPPFQLGGDPKDPKSGVRGRVYQPRTIRSGAL